MELSDAPESLLSPEKELCVHVFTYACLGAFACDGGLGSTWEGEEYALFSFLLHPEHFYFLLHFF